MKLLLFAIFFSSFAQSQVLISGYDDVLRQSNNTSFLNVFKHFFEEDLGYTGMNRLYRMILKRTGQKSFHLLSGTPRFLEGHVDSFLKAQDYPPRETHLRNILFYPFLAGFRHESLREICPQKDCIWIADNSDSVLEVMGELKDWRGDLYARETIQKKHPEKVKTYVTTFDLALHELRSGRVSRKDVEAILVDLQGESNPELLIPTYAYCPLDYDPCDLGIFPLCERFKLKIQGICSTRRERNSK